VTTDQSPEPLLLEVISLDADCIRDFALRWVREYLSAGESALAFDGLCSEIEDGNYVPSERAWELLKSAAQRLQLPHPVRKA
jgi:hypothetical protein